MGDRAWRVAALATLVAGGCAPGRTGIVQTLPLPMARTKLDVNRSSALNHAGRAVAGALPNTPRPTAPAWLPHQGLSRRWDSIVIHHSGGESGNAARFDRYHRNIKHWDELGYHFVIGNGRGSGDGQVEVGSRWTKQKHGAHCKTPDNRYNEHGIGICLVGDFRSAPPTPAQLESLTGLVRFLMQQCGIRPQNVVTHHDVNAKTVCPGPMFPFYALRSSFTPYGGASALP